MKQDNVFLKSLKIVWALMLLGPVLALATRGMGARFFICSALYAMGTLLFWVALKRDPYAPELRLFTRTVLARATGVSILLMLVVLRVLEVTLDGLFSLLIVMFVGLFALWALCRSAEGLRSSIQNMLVMGSTVAFGLVLGEVIFRLPPVVARTGGNTPGMIRWQAKNYDQVVRTKNPLGLRSLHLNQAKPEGVSRIVTLGDSFTWGDKIARTEDTWPYVVEQTLQQRGHRPEVINMGHTGFTTVNEAELLKRVGWQFDPSLIVVQYNLNDPLPSGPNYFRETEDWLFRTKPLLPVFEDSLDQHSYLYSFLDAQYRGLQITRNFSDGYKPLYVDDFSGWKDAQAAMREMGDETRKRNVPVLVVIFPSFVTGLMDDSSYPYLDIHRKIISAAEAAGLHVLDLRPIYAQYGRTGRSWWALPCDGHPSVEADRVAGEAITRKIEELGLLRQPGLVADNQTENPGPAYGNVPVQR